jgi:uncharacterized protein with PQ loop repeat
LTFLGPNTVGTIACILTLILCISPLTNLGVVIRTRNAASIPVAMTTVMLFSNIAWTMYGIVLEDRFIYLPSLFGFVIAVFQLLVTAWCSEVLFYDLSFLEWVFKRPMSELVRHSSSASSNTVGVVYGSLEEDLPVDPAGKD